MLTYLINLVQAYPELVSACVLLGGGRVWRSTRRDSGSVRISRSVMKASWWSGGKRHGQQVSRLGGSVR